MLPGEVALGGSANASLALAGAGSANEQLAAPFRSKLARRKKDHQVLFVVRYRDQPDAEWTELIAAREARDAVKRQSA